jgi:WD40 repeat protein
MKSSFDAYVSAALFDAKGAVFALGDGTVAFESGERHSAHDGAVLSAAPHPSGEGVVTGGDDGRVVWTRASGVQEIADLGGKWVDALATSAESGLIAAAVGREVVVLDVKDAKFERRFRHERAAADVAFDPKGKRLAVATYGGVALWYARIADQKPQMFKWPGAHLLVVFSPDGRFVMSSMQENALHGWKIADGKDMKMAGYPAKIRSVSFFGKGALLATSGAPGVVVWPFAGPNGPMGREAVEIGYDESALVTRCVGAADTMRLAAGLSDGRVWAADLQGHDRPPIRAEKGAPVSALAITRDGKRLAFGDEAGEVGVVDLD